MPSLRGRTFGVLAALFVVAGWFFDRVELSALGVAAATALGSAVLHVRFGRSLPSAQRRIAPARVHHGAPCTVELTLVNRGRRTPPCLAVEGFGDPARAGGWPHTSRTGTSLLLEVPALEPEETVRATYRPATDRRGSFAVGPLTVRREDPFGLAGHDRELLRAGRLIVYPQIHPVAAMPAVPAQDLQSKLVRSAASLDGEEFFALRPYQAGDDLRRAHWPTMARTDELMVRQLEPPREPRVTVVLSVGAKANTMLSLDFTTSVAASIITASHRAGDVVRLVTSDGEDTGFDSAPAHWERALEMLAVATPETRASLAHTLRRLGRGTTGSVAVVTTAMTSKDLAAISWLAGRVGSVVLVLVERSAYAGREARELSPTPTPRQVRVVRVTDAASFPAAWAAAVARRRTPTPSRRARAVR